MKMKNITLISCLFLFANLGSAQIVKYEILYKSITIPITSPDFKWEGGQPPEKIAQVLKTLPVASDKTYSNMKEFLLTSNSLESSFINTKVYMANIKGERFESRQPTSTISPNLYKSWKKNLIYAFTNDDELWRTPTNSFQWKIHEDEKMNYLGYELTKATTNYFDGKEITAWFTEEVPIADGPSFLNGLPGLILRCRIWNKLYYATEVNISKKEVFQISLPTKKQSLNSFNEWIKKSDDRPIQSN